MGTCAIVVKLNAAAKMSVAKSAVKTAEIAVKTAARPSVAVLVTAATRTTLRLVIKHARIYWAADSKPSATVLRSPAV